MKQTKKTFTPFPPTYTWSNEDVVLPHVIEDLTKRAEFGLIEYGRPLHANNGRDALQDVYEELLDGACYIKQRMMENLNEAKASGVDETIHAVRKWATDKGIDKAENAPFQFLKVSEEVGELAGAMAREDYEGIVDGIGDAAITLIILSQQLDLNFEKCLMNAWEEIKDRTGKTENGVFVKDGES
jgi:NTP pyrophosphatase (non-canonical NTP hydrolase)